MSDVYSIATGVLLANLMTVMFLYGAWQVRGLTMDEAGDKWGALGCLAAPLLWLGLMLIVGA